MLSPDPALLADSRVTLGLRANWQQFALLVLVNAFVGGMVGLERAVLPLLAVEEFGRTSSTVILSFIVSFGLVKAMANLFAGLLSDRIGRKQVLITGWLFALPVPLIIIFAPTWGWIVFANVLLGINQGLCWSTTVIMKIDLAGPRRRGFAMGLNEAAGYMAVSMAALASGYLAAAYSLRPEPFYLGIIFALSGLLLSIFFVQDSSAHVRHETRLIDPLQAAAPTPEFSSVFRTTSWGDRSLFAVCQAGLVNNLNDGLAWGLLPLYFAANGASLKQIGWLAAIYPGVWGICQLGTGAASDRIGRKPMIVAGMWLQAASIGIILVGDVFKEWAIGAALLGFGTALVYPILLAAIGDIAYPTWRASSVGVYRLWRDGGYAIGALLAGILADLLGFNWAIAAVTALTFASGIVVFTTMYETLGAPRIILSPSRTTTDAGSLTP